MNAERGPLLVYDGDCGFCRRWIERWRAITGDRVEYAPYQQVAADFPEIARQRFAAAVQLIEPGGRVSQGAEAVFRSLSVSPRHGWLLGLYQGLPLFARASEALYRWVAAHRPLLSRATDTLWGRHLTPPGESRVVALFLRLTGAIYVMAFASLWPQLAGLLGERGILPARTYLEAARSQLGPGAFTWVPTALWWNASDAALHVVALAGVVFGLLAMAGIAPAAALAGAWFCYLSLVSVGQDFLWFQWDSLLLETGFVAILLAPWTWRMRGLRAPRPARAPLWLGRWLLFRLIFSSAVVKLTSGDPTWRSLTALEFHYETQPLPPWTAWYAHHWPPAFQKLSVLFMFAVEGLAPFALLTPRRLRFLGAAAIAALQVLILATGNYGVFNLLTLALCVLWLDDGCLGGRAPSPGPAAASRVPSALGLARTALVVALAVASIAPLAGALRWQARWLAPANDLYRLGAPFRLVNAYGLFAVMTTRRPEIVVEGSLDGATWRPYAFRWKPGEPLARRPAFVTPHMPRLDWQMWFAALGDARSNSWFLWFADRLLHGSAPLRGLLGPDPFGGAAPRYVRAVLCEYRFSDAATRRATGAWWTRREIGLYLPPVELVEGRMRLAAPGDSIR